MMNLVLVLSAQMLEESSTLAQNLLLVMSTNPQVYLFSKQAKMVRAVFQMLHLDLYISLLVLARLSILQMLSDPLLILSSPVSPPLNDIYCTET